MCPPYLFQLRSLMTINNAIDALERRPYGGGVVMTLVRCSVRAPYPRGAVGPGGRGIQDHDVTQAPLPRSKLGDTFQPTTGLPGRLRPRQFAGCKVSLSLRGFIRVPRARPFFI